ncbi:MAG: hypothetical protein R3D00_06590 [Bacteroidia bacterium]
MEAKPDDFQPPKGKNRLRTFRITAVLTGLVVAILLPLGYYVSTSTSGSPQKLFAEIHGEDIPSDKGVLLKNTPGHSAQFASAMAFFREGNYEKALAGFTDLIKTGPENDTLACYMGITHLELKHSDTAVFWLEKSLSFKRSGFISEKAEIYLGLAYVLKGDFPRANDIFNAIAANEKHTYHNEAIKAEARLLRYIEREEE